MGTAGLMLLAALLGYRAAHRRRRPQYAPRVPWQPDAAVDRRIAIALALPAWMYPGR